MIFIFVLAFASVAEAQSTSFNATVWQGVYTEAQAARGETAYDTHCASCHRDDLGGYNSILKGSRFMQKYRESSLDLLFEKTKTTMPRGAPASLSDTMYVDIVTYLLKENDFPAGPQELRIEDLTRTQLVGKDGPEPVPDFSLVRVVGCLTTSPSDSTWMMTHSTDPVRTGNPQPSPGEKDAAERVALGAKTYRLLASAAYKPELHKGHKVEVRGFLIRRPVEDRLNITSVETLDSNCGE